MSEIKPEDISDAIRLEVNESLEIYDGLGGTTESLIAEICNILQNHGFTVLKPGELHWVESNLGHSPEYREWRAVGANYEMQINDSILHEGTFNTILTELKTGHEIGDYSHPTLEAAKSYCQKLEDDAKGIA